MDVVVLLLTCILVVFFLGVTYEIVTRLEQITHEGREILENVLLAIISIISLYIGSKLRQKK